MKTVVNELPTKLHLPTEETVDFRRVVNTLIEYKWLIIAFTCFFTIIAIVYSYIQDPVYESNVLIQIKGKGKNELGGMASQLSFLPASTGNDTAAAQMVLIRSRFILEPVINKLALGLTIQPTSNSFVSYFNKNKTLISFSEFNVPAPYQHQKMKITIIDKKHYQLLDKDNHILLTGVIGKLFKKNDFSIKLNDQNIIPETSFFIVKKDAMNLVGHLINKLMIEELGDKTLGGGKTGILQISYHDTDAKRIPIILNTIATVAQQKDIELKSLETAKILKFLNDQIPLAKETLTKAETDLSNYRAKTGKLDIRFEMQHLLQRFVATEKKITELKMSKADLLERFTEKHPVILGLEEKLSQLEEQRKLLTNQIKALPASDQVAVSLMRDVRVKNQIYLVLLNKVQELSVTKAGTVSDLQILSKAKLPDSALSFHRPAIISSGIVLGFLLGCMIVIGRKAFTKTVTDPYWVEQHFGLINLAIIPYSRLQAKAQKVYALGQLQPIKLLAETAPRDLSIEAMRSLRTSLQLILSNAENNVISVMGINQDVGKSFIAANLAYLLANASKRVLLIDGDLRKGHLHHYFNMKQSPGLSDILTNKIALTDAIKTTANAGLDFLPAGTYPLYPAELLLQPHFKELLHQLSHQYDLIVFDTTPILSVTDGLLIASCSDTNLLVLGSDRHQSVEINLAIKRLHNAHVKISGTIFNILKSTPVISGYFHYNDKTEHNHSKVS